MDLTNHLHIKSSCAVLIMMSGGKSASQCVLRILWIFTGFLLTKISFNRKISIYKRERCACRLQATPFVFVLPFRRERVSPMTISRLNTPIFPMDQKLGSLVPADSSPCLDSGFFSGVVPTGTLSSTPLNIPTALAVVDNMMSSPCHVLIPYALSDSRWRIRLRRCSIAYLLEQLPSRWRTYRDMSYWQFSAAVRVPGCELHGEVRGCGFGYC